MAMLSVEEARARLLAPLQPLAAEQVALSEAVGRVLAERSRGAAHPAAGRVSAMDGYAVRAADVARCRRGSRWSARSPPARPFAGTVGRGEAVRIFTGAPMPDGADTVVIQEDTERATATSSRSREPWPRAAMSARPGSISARAMSARAPAGG